MDLKENQNIFRLFIEGFRLANRAMLSVLISLVLLSAVLLGIVFAIDHFGLPKFLISILKFIFNAYTLVLIWRLLAAKADNFGESISNAMRASVKPAAYMAIFSLLLAGGWLLCLLAIVFLPWALRIIVLLGAAFVGLRLAFASTAIALKDQGPVSALIYSWELTGRNFWKTLGMCLLSFGFCSLLSGALVYAAFLIIPLYFADSFSLVNLTLQWKVALVCFGLFLSFIWVAGFSSFLLFFLNCDYGANRGSFTSKAEAQLVQQPTQVFGEDNNVLPPGVGKTVSQEDVKNLGVVKSSVRTGGDSHELKEHLQQVYTPRPDDTVQYADEDRMPTILFDDDMAKQMEENRKMWEAKKKETAQKKEDDNGQSIKMSK